MCRTDIQHTNPCLCFVSPLLFTLLFLLPAANALAQNTYCPIAGDRVREETPLNLSAQSIRLRKDGKSILDGQVQIEKGANRIRANRVIYDDARGRLKLEGGAQYTNCDPASPLWFLSAQEASYSTAKERGLIKNAWLHFGGMPVLYLPRYRFLTGEKKRKSGLLTPKLANSSSSGKQIALPLYFNLAANKDAMFTTKYYSKRGVQYNLGGRYLYPLEHGSLEASWLDDRRFDKGRYAYRFSHFASAGDIFSLDATLQHVSDDYYLEDLGGRYSLYGDSYLRSHATARWFLKGWNIRLLTEKLNRSDHAAPPDSQPYQKRPQLSIARDFMFGNSGLRLGIFSETTQFTNKHRSIVISPDETRHFDRGLRAHNQLDLEWSYRRPGFYFMPAVVLNHTHYKRYAPPATKRASQRRTVPSFSVRSGLVFEKDFYLNRYKHTIEPQLFYLNIPRRNQDALPLFDTSESEFRFAHIFDINRFNGVDRISDADRMTVGLNSRVMHKRTGIEAARISIGKSYHFRSPRTTVFDDERIDERSHIVTEAGLNLNNKVRFLSSLIWNTKSDQTVKNAMSLSFHGSNDRSINLFYRQKRYDFEQAGIGFNLPISDAWSVFSGVSYDMDSKKVLTALGGIKYQSCCWGLSFGIQRRLKNVFATSGRIKDGQLEYDNFVGVQFSLQGIGKLGEDIDSLAEQSTFSY